MPFWVIVFMVPFALVIVLFFIMWTVQEGSRWQKHRYLGVFARYIQASAGRAFATFAVLTFMTIPTTLMLLLGIGWDILAEGGSLSSTVPVVNTLLLLMLLLSGMIPVLWSSFRTWRQALRSAAEVKVRTLQ